MTKEIKETKDTKKKFKIKSKAKAAKATKSDKPTKINAKPVKAEKATKVAKAAKNLAAKKPAKAAAKSTEKKPVTKAKVAAKAKSAAKVGGKPKSLQIIPLGGLEKIGMNITAIRYEDSIIVVDCGMSFPDETMPGVDKVIPDITYLKDNADKVKAFFITHGHEDHIGALPFILPQLNVPVYATRLTMGLIEHKLEEAQFLSLAKLHAVKAGKTVSVGDFSVEFIKMNHSIPDACALAIRTPAGTIFHTGDFKVDFTPLYGDAIDLARIAQIGKEGVLALLSDSTNAMREGVTPSETMVAETFDELFAKHTKRRIIIATFSSNLDRVQQIFDTARKYGRKVILQGRSMETTVSIAQQLGYVTVPQGVIIDVDEAKDYPDDRLVFITTGSQGEAMAALSKMADSTHKKVKIKPGDVIVFSSKAIPGNEKAVTKVMNQLAELGANIIYQDTHVSGHACQQEISLIYSLVKPLYAVPVHGEYRHLVANADIAKGIGVKPENVFILRSGDVLSLSAKEGKVIDKVTAREVYIDGIGSGDVASAVIRDRQTLAECGFVAVSIGYEPRAGYFLASVEITTRGFIYVKESGETLDEMKDVVYASMRKCEDRHLRDIPKIKSIIKQDLEDYIWKNFERRPVVIPMVIEVDY